MTATEAFGCVVALVAIVMIVTNLGNCGGNT